MSEDIQWLTEEEQGQLNKIFEDGAKGMDLWPEHWIGGEGSDGEGYDQSAGYCLPCAKKIVQDLLEKDPTATWIVDGGWGSDADSFACCDVCHKSLDISPTDYCCEVEVEHFLEHGFDPTSQDDCYCMDAITGSHGWGNRDRWGNRDAQRTEGHYQDLHKLGRIILTKMSLAELSQPKEPSMTTQPIQEEAPTCPCGELLSISLGKTSPTGIPSKSCPECPRRAGHHVYYLLDQFGQRDCGGSIFTQSWCKSCRGKQQQGATS